ncbi:MAG: tripartite tricarboxylate transporter TctB family protein [Ruminococcaceae bacterium]|nr:tripartite tricarboxylate transporter TctB family protein [Oscillospiraceae bacterium]
MKSRRYNELAFGVLIAAFDIFYFSMTLMVQRKDANNFLDARFFPYLLCVIFTVLAVCQIILGVRALKTYDEKADIGKEKTDTATVIKTFFAILVYILLLDVLGFIISTIAFLTVMFAILCPASQKRNFVLYIIVSTLVSLFVYLSFRYLLTIMLPQGILTFI